MSFEKHPEIKARIEEARLIAVVTLHDTAHAVPLAQALLSGGVKAIELTLRTPEALDCIEQIRTRVPQMLVGAGTVLSTEQVGQVLNAGAEFAVSPGLNAAVVRDAMCQNLPFAPGVCTPTDIEAAVDLGCRLLKFFPAQPIGGIEYLKAIAAPYAHLGVQYIPLGGVRSDTLFSYLKLDVVTAVGGSWVTPKQAIQTEQWSIVTQLAQETMQSIAAIQEGSDS